MEHESKSVNMRHRLLKKQNKGESQMIDFNTIVEPKTNSKMLNALLRQIMILFLLAFSPMSSFQAQADTIDVGVPTKAGTDTLTINGQTITVNIPAGDIGDRSANALNILDAINSQLTKPPLGASINAVGNVHVNGHVTNWMSNTGETGGIIHEGQ